MTDQGKISSREYWENNIQRFSGFYDKGSQEDLQGPRLLTYIYKKTVFPLEKRYMKQRFNMVSAYIAEHIRPGMSVADIGCGAGVYTQQMAFLGAKVYALDFTKSALELTRKKLTPEESRYVEFVQGDALSCPIPPVDSAIAIGVVPYIERLDGFFAHILPYTQSFLFNFLDAGSIFNVVRRMLPALDVRGYHYFSVRDIRRKLAENNFEIIKMEQLATGFMVQSRRML